MKKGPRDKSLGAQMAIALQLMKRKNHKAIKSIDCKITMEQLAVLETLKTNGDMNMSELSKTVWKQNANITRIVDKLEKRNLVERKAVEGDRRANLICITPIGKDIYKKIIPVVVKTHKDSISCITKEEETATIELLKKIIIHLS